MGRGDLLCSRYTVWASRWAVISLPSSLLTVPILMISKRDNSERPFTQLAQESLYWGPSFSPGKFVIYIPLRHRKYFPFSFIKHSAHILIITYCLHLFLVLEPMVSRLSQAPGSIKYPNAGYWWSPIFTPVHSVNIYQVLTTCRVQIHSSFRNLHAWPWKIKICSYRKKGGNVYMINFPQRIFICIISVSFILPLSKNSLFHSAFLSSILSLCYFPKCILHKKQPKILNVGIILSRIFCRFIFTNILTTRL